MSPAVDATREPRHDHRSCRRELATQGRYLELKYRGEDGETR